MSTVVKDLGAVSAYAYAVEKGYTGTEAEFAELMADYAEVGQRAEDAADSALESKTAAQTAATTATNKATEATTAATTATTKAAEAQADADAAALDASQALSAASTATTKATEATTAAATATSAKTDAVAANTAAQSAKTAAQTAQTGAETAAASVSASAAQIATNAEDISQLKSELIHYYSIAWNDNGYVNSTGNITTNSSSKYSDFIEIEYDGISPEILTFEKKTAAQWIVYAFYNGTTFITNSYAHTEDNIANVEIPLGATHFRISAANVEYAYVNIYNGNVEANAQKIAKISDALGYIYAHNYDLTWNANGYVSGAGIVTNANNYYTDFFDLAINGAIPKGIVIDRPVLTNWVNYAFFNDTAYISGGYLTEETGNVITIPAGATKMRFSTAKSTYANTIAKEYRETVEERINDLNDRVGILESDKGNVAVTLSNNDISFASRVEGGMMVLTAEKANSRVDSNPIFNFSNYYLNSVLFKSAGDDIAPIQINQPNMSGTYIGGGHGFSNGLKLTTSNSKTDSDIGSVWKDANNVEFVLYNVGDGYVKVVNATTTEITSPLTHVSGATNTESIVFASAEMAFILPALNKHMLSIYDDKGVELTENGTYYGNYIDIIESYNILDPLSVITYLKANVGNCTNDSVADQSIDALCKVNIVYRITDGCSCTIYQSIDSIKDISYSYAGLTQAMSIGNYAYVPGAFNNDVQTLTGTSLNVGVSNWNDATKVPYRFYQFSDNYNKGFFIGYYPKIGTAINSERITKCSSACLYYGSTKKMYPRLINSTQILSGNTIEAVCFRTPVVKRSDGSLAVVYNYVGNDIILNVDYQAAFNGFITIPEKCVGKQIEVVDKTASCTITRAIASSTQLPIKFSGKGYAVLRFY